MRGDAVIHNTPIVLDNPRDYDARAQIMWAGTIAHNDLLSTGRVGDWATHQIEHELSGVYDVAHGAGLAVLLPAWMRHVCTNPATGQLLPENRTSHQPAGARRNG